MDPLSAIAGVLQIVAQAAVCTVALAKWIGQVKTVNERLQSFYNDVLALKATSENLERSLKSPAMIEAARSTKDSSGDLWSQVYVTLEDCRRTLISINQTLDKISKPTTFGRPQKQLMESLNAGDLARYYQRIQMFNVSLQLPLQVITIKLQLSQRDMSQESHREVMNAIGAVQLRTKRASERLKSLKQIYTTSRRPSSSQASTMIDIGQVDGTVYDNLEKYIDRMNVVISSASTTAGSMSSMASVVQDGDTRAPTTNVWRGSEHGVILTHTERQRIDSWVPNLPPQELPTPAPSEQEQLPDQAVDMDNFDGQNDSDDNLDLELVRTYVEHGQADMDKEDYAAAEENFREALDLLSDHDFGQTLAIESADVSLMLAHCCYKQGNYEEAVGLLQPITEPEPQSSSKRKNDPAQVLEAHHMLGMVYLKMQDFRNAEKYGLSAFSGRRKHFREHHPKYIESVQLVVDIYKAMGKEARAKAYGKFLTSPKPRTVSQLSGDGLAGTFTRQMTLATDTSPQGYPGITLGNSPPLGLYQTTSGASRSPSNVPDNTFADDSSISTSFTRTTSMKPSDAHSVSRSVLEPNFLAVRALAAESRTKAVNMAIKILKNYEPNGRILIVRTDDIKKNIKERGLDMGLAATGHGYAPIHFFCELPDYEAMPEVEFLIEHGVDLGAACYKAGLGRAEPMTPLQLTIERGHENLSMMIIDALHAAATIGRSVPDINVMSDRQGLPPLLAACRRGQPAIVLKLLEYGARVVNGFPPYMWCGNSLLHDASSRCDIDMVKMLLEYQERRGSMSQNATDVGSMHQQDKFGITPLIYAVVSSNINLAQRSGKINRRRECVRLLLEHGSRKPSFDQDLLLRDEKGVDVFGHVEKEQDEALKDLISRYGRMSRSSAPPKELE